MAEPITRHYPLEECISDSLSPLIELVTKEVCIDMLDVESPLINSPDDIESIHRFAQNMLVFFDTTEDEAAETVQRAFFFAYKVSEMAGMHDFELELTVSTDSNISEDQKKLYLSAIEGYLYQNPSIEGLIRAFTEELDASEDGRFEHIARAVAGLTFLLIDIGMESNYYAQTAAELDYLLSQTESE